MSDTGNDRVFEAAARRAQRRLVLAQWARLLSRSAVVSFAIVLAGVIVLRLLGYRYADWLVVAGVALAWLAGALAWAWATRPTPRQALAEWDRRAGRHEAFLSAMVFESQPEPTDAESLHLRRARGMLAQALPELRRHIPSKLRAEAVVAPLVVLVFALTPLLVRPLGRDELPLDAAAHARAMELGQTIAQEERLEKLPGLTPQEKARLEALQKQIEETAAQLQQGQDQTPNHVLSQLEALARQAEELAEAMGEGESEDSGSALLEELERHADTADFASAMRASKTREAADEARGIANRLKSSQITLDERDRFRHAFEQGMQAATERDKQKLVGRHVGEADERMRRDQPREAGEQFDRLAERLDRKAQREAAQERLEQLAARLRSGGQEVFDSDAGSMQQLTQAGQQGLQPLDAAMSDMMSDATPQGRGMGSFGRLPMGRNAQGQRTGRMAMGPPVPGQQPRGGQRAGQGQPRAGLVPPIPGQGWCPGGTGTQLVNSLQLRQRQGNGLKAGTGSAAYLNNMTNPRAASATGTVSAPPVNAGESIVQDVEGQHHREEAARQSNALALEFIAAQEEALDAESLPMARREQVVRYFQMLRSQLEQ